MNAAGDPWVWYTEIPIISRVYLTSAVITTTLCALDVISPFSLYFNFGLIFYKGQIWRLGTNFLYFGSFGLDFLFHMYFLVRYSRLLEEGDFRGRTADFAMMLLLGAILMTFAGPFVKVHFLGNSLTFMMVYVWGRRNEHVRMNFLGMIPFTAPYLPWVLLAFSVLLGNPPIIDIIGIVVGHLYFFFEYVFPEVARLRGWSVRKVIKTPAFLHQLFGTYIPPVPIEPIEQNADQQPLRDENDPAQDEQRQE
mmetsp:Transcript_30034/g.39515  ORF Transcript_30034/g.39515 Transcript_30034/m.39515 type:complete len:251 (+) Transcript_30034:96-848(+)